MLQCWSYDIGYYNEIGGTMTDLACSLNRKSNMDRQHDGQKKKEQKYNQRSTKYYHVNMIQHI
jgi:hypothetical protein